MLIEFAPGTEPDLTELECGRCQEPMLHRIVGLSAHYPLCIHWYVECGECGYEAEAWEDRGAPIRYGGGGQASPRRRVLPDVEEGPEAADEEE